MIFVIIDIRLKSMVQMILVVFKPMSLVFWLVHSYLLIQSSLLSSAIQPMRIIEPNAVHHSSAILIINSQPRRSNPSHMRILMD